VKSTITIRPELVIIIIIIIIIINFICSPSATTSHYIMCSESVLCSRSYSLELS